MPRNCSNCKNAKKDSDEHYLTENENLMIPYVAHQSAMARQERQIKRMWIERIVAWVAVLAVVGIFTYERLQYDYTGTYEEIIVDAEDNGNANYIGQDGNIYNGEDNGAENNEETD